MDSSRQLRRSRRTTARKRPLYTVDGDPFLRQAILETLSQERLLPEFPELYPQIDFDLLHEDGFPEVKILHQAMLHREKKEQRETKSRQVRRTARDEPPTKKRKVVKDDASAPVPLPQQEEPSSSDASPDSLFQSQVWSPSTSPASPPTPAESSIPSPGESVEEEKEDEVKAQGEGCQMIDDPTTEQIVESGEERLSMTPSATPTLADSRIAETPVQDEEQEDHEILIPSSQSAWNQGDLRARSSEISTPQAEASDSVDLPESTPTIPDSQESLPEKESEEGDGVGDHGIDGSAEPHSSSLQSLENLGSLLEVAPSPPPISLGGFSTASGKRVSIAPKTLASASEFIQRVQGEMSEDFLTENSAAPQQDAVRRNVSPSPAESRPPQLGAGRPVTSPQLQQPQRARATAVGVRRAHAFRPPRPLRQSTSSATTSSAPQVGFLSARNSTPVQVSRVALVRAARFVKDAAASSEPSGPSEHISSAEEASSAVPPSVSMGGFATASGKTVRLTEQQLRAGERFVATSEAESEGSSRAESPTSRISAHPATAAAGTSSSAGSGFSGFSTAAGQSVRMSAEQLQRARKFVDENSSSSATSASTPSTPRQRARSRHVPRPISVSAAAWDRSREVLKDVLTDDPVRSAHLTPSSERTPRPPAVSPPTPSPSAPAKSSIPVVVIDDDDSLPPPSSAEEGLETAQVLPAEVVDAFFTLSQTTHAPSSSLLSKKQDEDRRLQPRASVFTVDQEWAAAQKFSNSSDSSITDLRNIDAHQLPPILRQLHMRRLLRIGPRIPFQDFLAKPVMTRVTVPTTTSSSVGMSGAADSSFWDITSRNALACEFQGRGWAAARAELLAWGALENLCSEAWAQNHWRWSVWKYACLQRQSVPRQRSPVYWTWDRVIADLKFRYHRECNHVKRSCLRLILEADASPARAMVLCVADILDSETAGGGAPQEPRQGTSSNGGEGFRVLLTDGWYGVETLLDPAFRSLASEGKLFVGLKLRVAGAQLIPDPRVPGAETNFDGVMPLERHDWVLRIPFNGVRRAYGDTKLGWLGMRSTFPVSLASLRPQSGLLPQIRGLVLRVWPLQYLRKWSDPSESGGAQSRRRNQKAEDLFQQSLLAAMESRILSPTSQPPPGESPGRLGILAGEASVPPSTSLQLLIAELAPRRLNDGKTCLWLSGATFLLTVWRPQPGDLELFSEGCLLVLENLKVVRTSHVSSSVEGQDGKKRMDDQWILDHLANSYHLPDFVLSMATRSSCRRLLPGKVPLHPWLSGLVREKDTPRTPLPSIISGEHGFPALSLLRKGLPLSRLFQLSPGDRFDCVAFVLLCTPFEGTEDSEEGVSGSRLLILGDFSDRLLVVRVTETPSQRHLQQDPVSVWKLRQQQQQQQQQISQSFSTPVKKPRRPRTPQSGLRHRAGLRTPRQTPRQHPVTPGSSKSTRNGCLPCHYSAALCVVLDLEFTGRSSLFFFFNDDFFVGLQLGIYSLLWL